MESAIQFNIFNSIILAGIIQGLVFGAIVLGNKKYRSPATLILAAFIVSFSLDNLQYLVEDIGLITEEDLYAVWFLPFELLSGALFLLYGLYVIEPNRQWKRTDKLFFLPFVFALLFTSAHKIIYASFPIDPDLFFDVEEVLEFLSLSIDLSVLFYLSIRIHHLGSNPHILNQQLRWFKIILISLLTVSIIWICITVADYFYNTEYWYLLYICMSIIVYWMGHIGIYKFGVEQERKKIRDYSIESTSHLTLEKQKNEHITALEKLLVSERRFLDPSITLDKLAGELHLSKSHLSRIINTELNMGFPDYLNSLRVEEAKLHLRNPDFVNYTLVAIGLEAGFNSKTTFNTAFKKATAMTPSEYRSSALN